MSWNHLSFVNISPTLVIDTSMERSLWVKQHGNPRIFFSFKKSLKFEFWLVTMNWNHLSFVNISPTIVIDTSMERSSRVLQHGHIKIWLFFQKNSEVNFDLYFVWLVFFLSSKLNFDLYLTYAKELKSFMEVSTSTYMTTSGMHRRPFQGRHLVLMCLYIFFISSYSIIN